MNDELNEKLAQLSALTWQNTELWPKCDCGGAYKFYLTGMSPKGDMITVGFLCETCGKKRDALYMKPTLRMPKSEKENEQTKTKI